MGHKIFVSYKYADENVKHISNNVDVTDNARTYVDELYGYLKDFDHIYKGEKDNEDLSNLSDETIWEKLKDRIFDSSMTIVLISKGMRETGVLDRNQWIPWEISYSLKETTRKNENGDYVTSHSNAMLAIVLPDKNGTYSYYTYHKECCNSGCRVLKTEILFEILKKNMFNILNPTKRTCDDGSETYSGESSYIISVKWDDFIANPKSYINRAYKIQDNIDSYDIHKDV